MRAIVAASNRSVVYSKEPSQRAVALGQRERQVEFAVPRGSGRRVIASPGSSESASRRVLQREHDLEQRIAAQVALGLELLDQLLEGQVLVRVGIERALARPGQQFRERRVAGEITAHDQRVDEEADEAFDLGPVAPGDRRADRDVLLARM